MTQLTTMCEPLESMRVFSQLSNLCHYIDIAESKYACIAGLILPYNVAVAVMLWVMTGNKTYSNMLNANIDAVSAIVDLNPQDTTLTLRSADVSWYLHCRLSSVMRDWTSTDFDQIALTLTT